MRDIIREDELRKNIIGHETEIYVSGMGSRNLKRCGNSTYTINFLFQARIFLDSWCSRRPGNWNVSLRVGPLLDERTSH